MTHHVAILSVRGQKLKGMAHHFTVRPSGRTDALTNAATRIAREMGMKVLAAHVVGHNADGNFYEVTFGRPVKGTNASEPLSVMQLQITG